MAEAFHEIGCLILYTCMQCLWRDSGVVKIATTAQRRVMCSTSAEGNAVALKAGTDLNCESYADLKLSYLGGLVSKADIKKAASRVMEHKFRLGVLDPPADVPYSDIPASVIGAPDHLLKATQAAQKGCSSDFCQLGSSPPADSYH